MLTRTLYHGIRARPLSTLLTPISTTAKGTAFENRCLEILQSNLSMSLERVGGASDGGVDIQGWWWLPVPRYLTTTTKGSYSIDNELPVAPGNAVDDSFPRRRIRVLGQCKAESKKMGPKYIREMEGVVLHYMALATSKSAMASTPPDSELILSPSPDQPIVGLVLSESAFTAQTTLRAMSSPVPFLLLHLPPTSEAVIGGTEPVAADDPKPTSRKSNSKSRDKPSALGSLLWNDALRSALLGDEIEARWERSMSDPVGRAALFWRGKRLPNWYPPNPVPL